MNRRLLLLALFIIAPTLGAWRFGVNANADGFTLEQVMSSPFPSDMIASPRGDKLAWVFDSLGRRNIWIAEAPEFKGHSLTHYERDDGQDITEPVFSSDGAYIAFVRGGPPNSAGEIPNPSSDVKGAKQEVWRVDTKSGALVKIGEGAAPLFAPSGSAVIYHHEDHLWIGSGPGEAAKLFEVRGEVGEAVWSPDGQKLAFVSTRGDHSFIGIYEPKSSSIRFLQSSIDRDITPRWSPDGTRIAFIRLFNVTDTYSADTERIMPWSIRVVNVTTDSGKEIWRSGKTAVDSFSSIFGDNAIQWAAGDRIVFGSEKSGWAHLYSISASGGDAIDLVPGNHEIEDVSWSPDKSFLIVSSNASDIDRRHLWKVNVAGGAPQVLTEGPSIEVHPVLVDGGKRIAFFHGTSNYPLLPYIAPLEVRGAKMLAAGALPSDFPVDKLIEPEQVIFKAADGVEIHGQLFKAKDASVKSPAIVFMHGGPIRQMLLGWHSLYYYHNSYALNQYLASHGFIVLSVNYRAGVGYGRAFREAKRRGARGASEYQDVLAGGMYLRSRDDIDAKKIGLWGGSYGGFLTAMGLARNSEVFAAGVDIHGVHDWSVRLGRGGPGSGPDMIKLARESSPIASVDKWKSPVLLIHGDDDRNVAFNQTVDLARKLRDQGVDFEQLIIPDEVHDLLRHESWLRVYHAAADFFERRLK
ncbi:MAG: S9 family peptidase [Blastocatellia bacterium AA13]|nr:MAG: S9 family peptidase [Blastocatellia bacterium AA13]